MRLSQCGTCELCQALPNVRSMLGLADVVELRRQELAGDRVVVVLGLAALPGRDHQAAPFVDVAVERSPVGFVELLDVEQEDARVGLEIVLVAGRTRDVSPVSTRNGRALPGGPGSSAAATNSASYGESETNRTLSGGRTLKVK